MPLPLLPRAGTPAQPITTAQDILLYGDEEADALQRSVDGYQQRDHDPLQPWDGAPPDDEESYDHHEAGTDPVAAVAAPPPDLARSDEADETPWDGADDIDVIDDVDNTTPDAPWSEPPLETDDDLDHHEGATEPIAFGGNPEIAQSHPAELDDEDYDAHEGSTDPVAPVLVATPDQPQDEPPLETDDDLDHHEGISEPAALGGDNEIRQSHEAEWAEDDYDAHDGSTDPIAQFVLALDPAQDEPPLETDDDLDHHEGATEPIAFGGNPEIAQSHPAELDDEDYDAHEGSTDPVAPVLVATPDQPQDEPPLETDDDLDHHEGISEPAALGGDPEIRQSFDAEWADDDYDSHDGSTDPVPQFVLALDGTPDEPPLETDDDLDHHEGVSEPVALGGDPEIRQSFDAEWADDDYDAHDGSGEPVAAVVVQQPEGPAEVPLHDQDDFEHHEGVSEPVALGGDQQIKQSFEAEWAEDDYDAHDGSSEPVALLAAVIFSGGHRSTAIPGLGPARSNTSTGRRSANVSRTRR